MSGTISQAGEVDTDEVIVRSVCCLAQNGFRLSLYQQGCCIVLQNVFTTAILMTTTVQENGRKNMCNKYYIQYNSADKFAKAPMQKCF